MTVVTVKELCKVLQISALTLRRLRAEGVVKTYRIRRRLRFVLEEVMEALARADSELPLRRGALPSHGSGKRTHFKAAEHDVELEGETDAEAD